MTPLEECGLQRLEWALDDCCCGGELLASPADFRGRGIIIDISEYGKPYDLTPHRVYLVWRHRLTRRRGCVEMFNPDDTMGRKAVYWPKAMARAEGTVECQAMISFADGGVMTSRTFLARVQEDLSANVDAGDGFTLFVEAIKRYEDARGEILRLADDLRKEAAVGGFAGPPGEPGIDGKQGPQGEPGPRGPAGFTPKVWIETDSEGSSTLSVTDAEGTTHAVLLRGLRGEKGDRGEPGEVGPQGPLGAKGDPGEKGDKGKDGVSPTFIMKTTQDIDFGTYGTASYTSSKNDVKADDLIVNRDRYLCRIESVTQRTNGTFNVSTEMIGGLRGLCFATCTKLDLDVGKSTQGYYPVRGLFVQKGDIVFSFDTGVVAVVTGVGTKTDFWHHNVQLKGIGRFALATASGK